MQKVVSMQDIVFCCSTQRSQFVPGGLCGLCPGGQWCTGNRNFMPALSYWSNPPLNGPIRCVHRVAGNALTESKALNFAVQGASAPRVLKSWYTGIQFGRRNRPSKKRSYNNTAEKLKNIFCGLALVVEATCHTSVVIQTFSRWSFLTLGPLGICTCTRFRHLQHILSSKQKPRCQRPRS